MKSACQHLFSYTYWNIVPRYQTKGPEGVGIAEISSQGLEIAIVWNHVIVRSVSVSFRPTMKLFEGWDHYYRLRCLGTKFPQFPKEIIYPVSEKQIKNLWQVDS